MSLLVLFPTGNTSENNQLTMPPNHVVMDTEGMSLRQHDGTTKGGYIHQGYVPPIPFKGEVSATDLITGNALASLIGLTGGTSINSDAGWLHFHDEDDDKTKYIAKRPFRHTISWDQIHAVNAVYGVEVTIQERRYICRLIRGSLDNPYTGGTGYDTPASHGSEWNRLMYRISKPTGNATYNAIDPAGPQFEEWASYDQTNDLGMLSGNGQYSWCQETRAANTSQRLLRGRYGVAYSYLNTSSNAQGNNGWRPLLELIE